MASYDWRSFLEKGQMMRDMACTHVWEKGVIEEYPEWYGCTHCDVLGHHEGPKGIVAAKCDDCGAPAITLDKREEGSPPVPVCQHCFKGADGISSG